MKLGRSKQEADSRKQTAGSRRLGKRKRAGRIMPLPARLFFGLPPAVGLLLTVRPP
jgi:hypothetical protein